MPANKENKPRPITTTPADLKKSEAYFDCANEAEPNESKANIGKVPKAKANIISEPEINDSLDNVAICMACVNPHGRKKVPAPTKSGARV